MHFLCLGYLNAEKMDACPEEEIKAVMEQCHPHLEKLYQTGQVLVDAGLASETKGLRRNNGRVTVLDGPFTETKEIIGSAFLIEARDLEDALRVATLHPAVQINEGERFGWRLEIRPVHHLEWKP